MEYHACIRPFRCPGKPLSEEVRRSRSIRRSPTSPSVEIQCFGPLALGDQPGEVLLVRIGHKTELGLVILRGRQRELLQQHLYAPFDSASHRRETDNAYNPIQSGPPPVRASARAVSIRFRTPREYPRDRFRPTRRTLRPPARSSAPGPHICGKSRGKACL